MARLIWWVYVVFSVTQKKCHARPTFNYHSSLLIAFPINSAWTLRGFPFAAISFHRQHIYHFNYLFRPIGPCFSVPTTLQSMKIAILTASSHTHARTKRTKNRRTNWFCPRRWKNAGQIDLNVQHIVSDSFKWRLKHSYRSEYSETPGSKWKLKIMEVRWHKHY